MQGRGLEVLRVGWVAAELARSAVPRIGAANELKKLGFRPALACLSGVATPAYNPVNPEREFRLTARAGSNDSFVRRVPRELQEET